MLLPDRPAGRRGDQQADMAHRADPHHQILEHDAAGRRPHQLVDPRPHDTLGDRNLGGDFDLRRALGIEYDDHRRCGDREDIDHDEGRQDLPADRAAMPETQRKACRSRAQSCAFAAAVPPGLRIVVDLNGWHDSLPCFNKVFYFCRLPAHVAAPGRRLCRA